MVWIRTLFAIGVAALATYTVSQMDDDPFMGRFLILFSSLVFLNALMLPVPYYVPQYMFTLVLIGMAMVIIYETQEIALAVLPVFLTLGNIYKSMEVLGTFRSPFFPVIISVIVAMTVFLFYTSHESANEIGDALSKKGNTALPDGGFLVDGDGSLFKYPEYVSVVMGLFALLYIKFGNACLAKKTSIIIIEEQKI